MLWAFFPGSISPMEMMVLGVVAVLLFGNQLPKVLGSVGRSVMEFRKGLGGIENELRSAMNAPVRQAPRKAYRDTDDRDVPTTPKFVPPPPATPDEQTPDEA